MNRILSLTIAVTALAAWLLPAAAFAADAAAGKEKYTLFCETCHGAAGQGDGVGAQGLEPPPRDFSTGEFKFDTNSDGTPGTDEDLTNVINQGAAAFGGSMLMTPWQGTMTDDDIANIVAFIRTLKK